MNSDELLSLLVSDDPYKYDRILSLSPPLPPGGRRPMLLRDRAAQFAPFAALSGYDEMITEAARRVSQKPSLSPEQQDLLDRKLALLTERAESGEEPTVTVRFFEPDPLKDGGQILTFSGSLRRIDSFHRCLIFRDGPKSACEREIPLSQILDMQSGLFFDLED